MNADTLIPFLVKRICTFARLQFGAESPAYKNFWQGQIVTYQASLKQVIKGAK